MKVKVKYSEISVDDYDRITQQYLDELGYDIRSKAVADAYLVATTLIETLRGRLFGADNEETQKR